MTNERVEMQLTRSQKMALEDLVNNGACSASNFDRHAFEALVKKGLAVKHTNGRQATYSLDHAAHAALIHNKVLCASCGHRRSHHRFTPTWPEGFVSGTDLSPVCFAFKAPIVPE